MSDSAVAVDFHKSLDVESYFTAKFTFNCVVIFDLITELCDIIFCKILSSCVRIDSCSCEDVLCTLGTDTVDIGQSDFYTL